VGCPNDCRESGAALESDMGAFAWELDEKGEVDGRAERSEGRSGEPTLGVSPARIRSQVEDVAPRMPGANRHS
jgi:hypothetical protein